MRYEPVSISNSSFFIANVMKDCPASTVIRELLQNAIEASGGRRIEWFRFDWNGVPKLGLYNEGPGMSDRELSERMNIASSGKELGRGKNFGQGAKMSAGKASPYGLLYRSCKAGIVWEIWLQIVDEPGGGKVLAKMVQHDEYNDEDALVRQVTDDAVERGRTLDREWTEAILLGRSDADSTIDGSFLGETSALWLSKLINQRYYRFPAGTSIHNATTTSNRTDSHRKARGLEASLSSQAITCQSEKVNCTHPKIGDFQLLYGKLAGTPKTRRSGPLAADGLAGGAHICLVWRNEIYDLDFNWIFQQGAYGFSGVSQDYYIHVLLPDNAPIDNNNHRTEVILSDPTSEPVSCEMFCNLIRDNRPQWILDDIRTRQDDDKSGRLQDRVRRLAEKFKAWMDVRTVIPGPDKDEGVIEFGPGTGKGGDGPIGPCPRPTPNGPTVRRGQGKAQERPRPETITADFRDETDLKWHEVVVGKAGHYDVSDNKIWLSREFDDFKRLQVWVDQTWPTYEDNQVAALVLKLEYCFFACSLGVAALSFRGNEAWSPDQWEKGLTPEAISFHLRDPAGAVRTAIKTQVRSKLNEKIREQTEAVNA